MVLKFQVTEQRSDSRVLRLRKELCLQGGGCRGFGVQSWKKLPLISLTRLPKVPVDYLLSSSCLLELRGAQLPDMRGILKMLPPKIRKVQVVVCVRSSLCPD